MADESGSYQAGVPVHTKKKNKRPHYEDNYTRRGLVIREDYEGMEHGCVMQSGISSPSQVISAQNWSPKSSRFNFQRWVSRGDNVSLFRIWGLKDPMITPGFCLN